MGKTKNFAVPLQATNNDNMAKKKKQTHKQPPMSPDKYIREKGRLLPVEACYVNADWKESGLAHVTVARRHAGGTYTLGMYLTDTFCLGVKDTFYHFSISDEDYEELLDNMEDTYGGLQQISYEEAHNLIYGAIAFAEEAGIHPHKGFATTQYLLEEDTEDVPLIEYEYGRDGKHYLFTRTRQEAARYLPILRKHLGDNFDYVVQPYDEDEDEDEDEDDEEYGDDEKLSPDVMSRLYEFFKKTEKSKQDLVPYTYQHPEYPKELKVDTPWLHDLLKDPDHYLGLTDKALDRVLALPHGSLRHDLEQIILWETGRTCEQQPDDDALDSTLANALILLGEVGDEHSLDVVLETLRQTYLFYDYHIGDCGEYMYPATLYLLGKNHLDKLYAFMEETGLDSYSRYWVTDAMVQLVRREPERRPEAIEWYRRLLKLYAEKMSAHTCCDSTLFDFVVGDLIELQATELMPEIKAVYNTGEGGALDYETYPKVVKAMEEEPLQRKSEKGKLPPLDVRKRFHEFRALRVEMGEREV